MQSSDLIKIEDIAALDVMWTQPLQSANNNATVKDHQSSVSPGKRNRNFNRSKPIPPGPEMLGKIIEEDLKNVSTSCPFNASKSPVSVLQELLSRRGITPVYELVQIEGAIHEPIFRYRVSFNNKDGMGAGRSKKEAKHMAAKALIDQLTESGDSLVQANGTVALPASKEVVAVPEAKKVLGNPIGWLQEMCMSRRWPPPTYETELEVGLPHERQFTIACTVFKYREIGQGKSKKIAKRLAANKMYRKLKETPLDGSQVNELIEEQSVEEINRVPNAINRYAELKDVRIPVLNTQNTHKVSQFHKSLKATTGKAITKLQKTCLSGSDINYIQFLQEIAAEHQFEVTYVDIEEKTYSGRIQCLVQLSTLPVAVCQGSGMTSKDAQLAAALNALEYLKIMSIK